MKTFVVLSDSHGRKKALEKIKPLFAENDFVVHLGVGSTDMRETFSEYPDKTYICKGNCDFVYGADEFIIEEEGVSVLCCHGHKYGVKSGLSRLAAYAKKKGCEVALYGHTHRAAISEVDGVLCICPGSIGSYSDASYCYLVLHQGKATPTIIPITL